MYKYKSLQGQLTQEHLPCYAIKANYVTIPNGEVSYRRLIELLLLPKFDNSNPSVTRDKEVCHVIMR